MSSLFVIWSLTSFVFEVPSGAWADLVDRRLLLVAAGPIYAAGFATWILWPTYAGFAVGFVLWGLSSALMSGTFEALLYDELAARGEADAYTGVFGWANAAAMAANLVATALAAPLLAWGGYAAVAWTSVAVALLHGLLACSLPSAPKAESVDDTHMAFQGHAGREADGDHPFLVRYVSMLRTGVREATTHAPVRRLLVIVSVLYGLTAFDEYFGVIAREAGSTTADVPLLVAITVAGQMAGTALGGRAARLSPRAMSILVAASAVLMAGGALSGHPAGFVAIGAGYGLIENVVVVSDAKLQDAISGPARATVTSVSGFSSEVVAVVIFAFVGAGSTWWSFSVLLAMCCVPVLAIAGAVRAWWPWQPRRYVSDGASDSMEG